jgi:hypothetical protein
MFYRFLFSLCSLHIVRISYTRTSETTVSMRFLPSQLCMWQLNREEGSVLCVTQCTDRSQGGIAEDFKPRHQNSPLGQVVGQVLGIVSRVV